MSAPEPTRIAIGESARWKVPAISKPPAELFPVASSSEFDLEYRFEGQGTAAVFEATVAGAADGAGWVFELAGTEFTQAIRLRWQLWATEIGGGARAYLERAGRLDVVADLATAGLQTPIDPSSDSSSSHAERMVAILESVLEGKASRDAASYQIAGRSVTRIPIVELRELLRGYRLEAASEASVRRVGAEPGRRRPARVRF